MICKCSATRMMAGQRQPDGRSLRATMMAWLTCRDKQKCRRSPLCGEYLTVKRPVDLCITQAHYTQLQPAHQKQPRRTFYKVNILRQSCLRASAEAAPLLGGYGHPAVALAVAGAPRFAWCTGGGDPSPIAFDVHFEDRRVVDKPVHSGQRHGGVREDARPFAKRMISRNYQAAPFVTGSDQLEQDRGLGLILSHIAKVFEDEQVVFVELLDGTFQRQGLPSLLQTLHKIGGSGEQDPVAVLDEAHDRRRR